MGKRHEDSLYATTSIDDPLPTYDALPSHFTIKGQARRTVVSADALKRHLLLLAAFDKLKQQILSDKCISTSVFNDHNDMKTLNGHSRANLLSSDSAVRWSVFVSMAVYRLCLWIDQVVIRDHSDPSVECLPPLDVALVLHTYRLNPRWYREDILRKHSHLGTEKINNILLGPFVDAIDAQALELVVSQETQDRWFALTDSPWDPIQHLMTSPGRLFKCPKTGELITAPWMTDSGTGWAQQSFAIQNSHGDIITHESLGLSKLIEDFCQCQTKNAFVASTRFLPGDATRNNPTAVETRRQRTKNGLFRTGSTLATLDRNKLSNALGSTLESAAKTIQLALKLPGRTRALRIMMSAYTRGEPFSIDLAAAVLRQGTFIDKMKGLGYLQHTTKYLGMFVDHDDKVEEGALSNSFDITARLWMKRFGVPYSICGCPIPELPKGKKPNRLLSKLGFGPEPQRVEPRLLASSNEQSYTIDDLESTHPSEHPSIIRVSEISSRSKKIQIRNQILKQSKERDQKLAQQGQLNLFVYKSLLSRSERDKSKWVGTTNSMTTGHTMAFLYPMPLDPCFGWNGYPIHVGGPDGIGCAATTGSIVGGDHCQTNWSDFGSASACTTGSGISAGGYDGSYSTSSCAAMGSSGGSWGGFSSDGGGGGGWSGGGGGGGCGGGGGSSGGGGI
ncbi:hypothetical protein OIO90_004954 [Microbotryomycetes sp. JL221]|nr:hypothetical protein OIO90_004954 [Microbotryomycetes sp. JL221]